MLRQSTTPVQFETQTRTDEAVIMTSGRAGKVVPVDYIPVLRGDSLAGQVSFQVELAEMPKPVKNAVVGNFQAWFVPKSAHPQFSGNDEFMAAYQQRSIEVLGEAPRDPPPFFYNIPQSERQPWLDSDMCKAIGWHTTSGTAMSGDFIDAYNLIQNFRLAAVSNKLERRPYAQEDLAEACTLAPAFWPTNRFTKVVADYERALILGQLDLDLISGQMPISGLGRQPNPTVDPYDNITIVDSAGQQTSGWGYNTENHNMKFRAASEDGGIAVFAELEGQTMGTSLADIDTARKTQAFAKLRAQLAGADASGFSNEDTILAELMQGFSIPPEQWNRPILLDAKKAVFGMQQRHSTDSEAMDVSVSLGFASATLSLNLPQQNVGGIIIITCEVMPERIFERQCDEWWLKTNPTLLPDALRDVQNPEPVEVVYNRRLDSRHTDPQAAYGYEPMNDEWNRSFTRLGGVFYQDDPSNPFVESRAGIWQTGIVNPEYTAHHFVAPNDLPHDIFADTEADAFEVAVRHNVTIRGLTQIGDTIVEDNDDYSEIQLNEI